MFPRSNNNVQPSQSITGNPRRAAFSDLTNANKHENNGGKPGQNILPEKRGARSDAFVPANRQPSSYQHSNHQSVVLEQRNPEEDHRELSTRQRVMHRQHVDNPVVLANPSSYQFGPADNIDERDAEDPLCATEYVQDMYDHFREKEAITSVRPLYMENQTHINERMRSILVDWLVEVHLKFKLVPETLYLTINLIDRYLERQEVSRPRLQLVGVTSLLIASKYEEIYPPELRDLVYICDRAYTRKEIIEMEEQILKTLEYNITIPSAHAFLVRYLKAAHADKRIVQLSCFILDGTLQSYNLLHYLPSQLAAAAVFIARRTVGRNSWSPTLLRYAVYREEEIAPVAKAVMAEKSSAAHELRAVNKKYTSSRYGAVANLALGSDY
uniref:Cyclin N-terminal domain-containing protein n=1 Tax=Pseudo-nitzschia australis TaxID=44445 RepID=A0A7S4AAP4_9STRA|mmetsp:Transcript_8007/g.17222  ORF Transcript_8007/g.17222 Transcript_8007/m.17222 type:complete len:384 (-) Transcript_8007:474-1625(-)|eukprot:CAMPEP_0168196198 /NCGR_PEP_ID=MMETSP0139_2-20121125/20358_1 /TAXON_ID=44445 /ORGANISM="Pseudo-nitzschia australis, Strain 10249 10 AB" /LENGTH=383 /DNA_ID=CAMNT_0008120297 /DNA_START=119 /DNA_END=1270 /DNA_ORIENTATION=+